MKDPHAAHTVFCIGNRRFACPFELAAAITAGKWNLKIVKALAELDTVRYGELKRAIHGEITHKMLIQSLKQLEADGFVKRTVYSQVPPKVEYRLTADGRRLQPVIDAMSAFGMRYKKER